MSSTTSRGTESTSLTLVAARLCRIAASRPAMEDTAMASLHGDLRAAASDSAADSAARRIGPPCSSMLDISKAVWAADCGTLPSREIHTHLLSSIKPESFFVSCRMVLPEGLPDRGHARVRRGVLGSGILCGIHRNRNRHKRPFSVGSSSRWPLRINSR